MPINKFWIIDSYKMDIGVLYSLLLFSTIYDSCVAENEETVIKNDETCNKAGKNASLLQLVLIFMKATCNEISVLAYKPKIINCR